MIKLRRLISILVLMVTLPMYMQAVTIEDKIAGLYAAFFNRAPDKAGFDMWKSKDDGSGSVLNEIAAGFSEHPVFTSTYGNLNDEEFVSLVYQNVLGKAGDVKGISDQVKALNDGTYPRRSDFIAGFVNSSLTLELTQANFPTLTAAELAAAQARQDLLKNKTEVSTYFVNNLGILTNVVDAVNPENDPAYLASIEILSGVNENATSATTAIGKLRGLINKNEAMTSIISSWDSLVVDNTVATDEISTEIPVNSPITDYFGDSVAFSNIQNGIFYVDCVVVSTNEVLRLSFNGSTFEYLLTFNEGLGSFDPIVVSDSEFASYKYSSSATSIPITAEIASMNDTIRYSNFNITSASNSFQTGTNIMIGTESCHVYHVLSSEALSDDLNQVLDGISQL